MSSTISFGNIYRLNGPATTGENIVRELQSDMNFKKKFRKKLSLSREQIYPYNSFIDSNNKSYIFTAGDSEKFFQSLSLAWDDIDVARSYCKSKSCDKMITQNALKRHANRIEDYINSHKNDICELNVECDKNGEIKSIDLVG